MTRCRALFLKIAPDSDKMLKKQQKHHEFNNIIVPDNSVNSLSFKQYTCFSKYILKEIQFIASFPQAGNSINLI